MKIRTRREFLLASTLSLGSFVISTGLSGCGSSEDSDLPPSSDLKISFEHGLASGDPLSDRVILWTRFSPDKEVDRFVVSYEVAKDEAFTQLVRPAQTAIVTKEGDYTLKVDYQNLEAGSLYYYRFKHGTSVSPVGKTKTLPDFVTEVKMAVFSCANYPKGYFNVYQEASKIDNLDVSLHLGDYIYEYGMYNKDGSPAYATENSVNIGRALPENNDTETIELQDYRKRYALYRTDAGAQALHKSVAMIAVWDDHEIANDAYKDGADNHNTDEGSFSLRKQAALQAYFEWMPIRPATEGDQETIYRSFDFGSLLSLHMLDTRIIARDKQLAYSDFPELLSSGDTSNFIPTLTNPNRALLGTQQVQWLQTALASSNATWQVLGQQVIMGRMQLPAELLGLIAQLQTADATTLPVLLATLNTTLGELAVIKTRLLQNDPSLSAQERARVETILPYNLDAWDGYFNEREVVLRTAVQLNKNLIVLAGDTHNGWANNLNALDNSYQATITAGVEFATPSVSSPGMEEYAKLSTLSETIQFEEVLKLLIDDLQYFNASDRGFMSISFTDAEVTSNWHYVDNIDSAVYQENISRAKTLKVLAGTNSIQL